MCIGVPAEVLEISGEEARVDVMGAGMTAGIVFVPEVKVGDFVLLHAGQAMAVIDRTYAEESIAEWRRVLNGRDEFLY
ncbi:HypC/HybG/HupF family hydrogenase formation chaperone [Alteribacter natronophilus]|uniref:HypC/HybG/HupF family hydrogenase formation chaperone n=1 Tax=Alteribacter natronophilus TaxID=2583810 RepID=UPI00110F3B61|nr:HypC/HybG/HupF family hydrogenase formation chaperone [Alteribacter natronophilus]TMW71430.1 HypC/HybG/HupF family hydrogenase formation chaperone [Alteribacter natronophilus]